MPVLHALEPQRWPRCARLGIVATLVFHAIIGLTPPPSNVSTYGVTTCTRLFFVLPDAVVAALDELCSGTRSAVLLGASMAAAAAASLAIVAPLHAVAVSTVQGEGTDWHLGYYAALCVLFLRGMLLELGNRADTPKGAVREGPSSRCLVGIALFYAFALPVLGLQEKAGCLMFSQACSLCRLWVPHMARHAIPKVPNSCVPAAPTVPTVPRCSNARCLSLPLCA